jgi:PAS domain S-box-containing protein
MEIVGRGTEAARSGRAADDESAALERMSDAFYAVDAGFRFTYVNHRAEALWGRRREELLGRHYWTAFPQAVGSESYRMHHRAMAERRALHYETRSPLIGRPIEVSLYPDAGGGLSCYFRDVGERRAQEAALRESEASYRSLFASIDEGFCVVEMILDEAGRPVDYRWLEANPAFEQQTGLAAPIGRTARELVPTLEPHWVETYGRVALTGEASRFQNGSEAMGRWFDVYAFRVGSPAHRRVAILFTDITAARDAARERERLLAQSEQARAEAADLAERLRASEARYRAIVEQGPAALAVLEGPDHVYSLVSPAYEAWAGRGALTGRAFLEALPELAGSPFDDAHRRVYATGEPLTVHEVAVGVARDGAGGPAGHVFTVHYAALRDARGAVRAVVSLVVEVTAQVQARREVEAARERSDAVLGSIVDPFYLLDRDWRFIHVNDAAVPLLQTTREALLGRTLWEAFPDVVGSPFEGPYREAMDARRATSAEAYFAPLGTWFDVRTYPWVGGVMVHFRDIGARKAAEAERERLLHALEVERARLTDVFRRAPSFIVVFRGPRHVYDFVNEAYYQLVGHRDVVGKPLLEAVPEMRGQGFDELLERVRQTGEPWVGRETPVQLQRTPGAPLETRYLDMVFQALAEADGTRSGVAVHGSDITAQVLARREVERLLGESERARAEAEAARAEAEAANRAKSDFLAVMSHELRTPLNAIGGYAELMEMGIRGPVTPQQAEDLRRIQSSQRHLLGLINEVLNYAKLETGTVHFDVADVPLREALAAAEALVAPQARAKALALVVGRCPADLAARADAEKLRQVLVNLLSNAVKFTDARGGRPGRIELACVADGARVAVRVHDTGIGIPADKLAAIFDPFVQVRADLTRTAEGTGLGLAISRDLARGMGGDLTAESTLGVGSTFTLTLPRA